MARIARVAVPGVPYHITHRGNRRSAVFYGDADREIYLALLAGHAQKAGLDIWAASRPPTQGANGRGQH